MVASNRLLEEVRDVLGRPKMRRYFPEGAVPVYLERLLAVAALAEDPTTSIARGVTPDPNDDYLVALASSGGASYLVSGDRHVLGLPDRLVRDGEGRILAHVLTPREFLELDRIV